MISRDRMFEPLLAACPSFRLPWEAFLAEWGGEPGEPPLYLALGDLCRHFIHLTLDGKCDEVRRVLAVVEAWHKDGDAYVREAAIIGFVETLGNILSHDAVGATCAADIRSLAGPETARWWAKVDAFWEGDPRALSEE